MKLMEIMKKHKRTILLSALAVMSAISIMSVGSTYAYLKLEAPSHLENRFTAAASVAPTVNDDYSVSVGATNYSVYVRAAIVVTWKDSEGATLATAPVAVTDYTIAIGEKWTPDPEDGFYYYKEAVRSRQSTDALITSVSQNQAAPEEGYSLSVDVVAQTIQAQGTTVGGTKAIMDAWNKSMS